VALLTKRLVDYGTGTNQVHLGVVPDTAGFDKVALTKDEQSIAGLKVFSVVVTSPNSAATLEEIEDNNEFVTFEQFGGYEEDLEDDFGRPMIVNTPGVITGVPARWTNIIDRETGTLIGVIPPSNTPPGQGDQPKIPPNTPDDMKITPLPENPGQYVLPGVGPGGVITTIGGKPVLLH
jgi:hypothetical protein